MACKLELFKEYPQPGEEAIAKALADYLRDVVVAQKTFLSGTTQRDVHGKGIAALKAQFTVDLDIPPELRHGVFAEPKSYPCWVRLSNGAQHAARDNKRDIRGFAIKLMGVPGYKLLPGEHDATTQDFLLFSMPIFFTSTAKEFFGLIKAANTNLLAQLLFGLTHPRVSLAVLRSLKRYGSLLEAKFWSTTPYRLGEIAVKYVIQPRSDERTPIPSKPGRNYLREAADRTLAGKEVLYDFFVQVQKDACREPIENALVEWKERLSPLHRVATIRIPKQRVATDERNQVAENIAMNIWHSLEAHRPLGNVNRSRGVIYQEIADFRRRRNLVPPGQQQEPTAGPDFFAGTSLADPAAGGTGYAP